MKRQVKQTLVWALTLALMSGCFAGTGVTATAEDASAPEVISEDSEGTAAITKVSLDKTQVAGEGDTVKLTVEGENLTADNWGIEVTSSVNGVAFDVTNKMNPMELVDVTETGATILVPANTMKNEILHKIAVGVKDGNTFTKQAEVELVQEEKNYSTQSLEPSSVVMKDAYTVVAVFEEELTAAREGEALKKLIYVADSENTYRLGENDTVMIDGNTVTVSYTEELKTNAASMLYIGEGAVKLVESGNILADFRWSITMQPRISSINLDNDLLDCEGGAVTATLGGYRVEEIDLDTLYAAVYIPSNTTATDIAVVKDKDDDGNPTLTFEISKNETENTQSYWLNVKYGCTQGADGTLVGGTPVYGDASSNRGSRATVSVLPAGKTKDDMTLSELTISGNNKNEDQTANVKNITVNVSNNIGELKTELRVYGTNLDSSKTKVRAIDENKIVWPVYQISECDGTWRFIAIAGEHRNGVFGNGNSQLIELLPPRYAGTNKTYTIQVAIDGENFIEDPCVTLTVNNEGISGESEFRDCTENNYKYVTVQYVDESGKEIAEKDVYKGYCITMPESFGIAPKQIEGYEVVEEPELDEWVEEGRTYQYVYKSTGTATPEKPATPTIKVPVKVSSVKVSGISKKLAAGKKVTLNATVAPANATNKAVTWKSSNTKYAMVNAAGKVTLKKAGAGKTVTITATAKDGSGKKATYKIKIMKNAVKSVKLKAAKTVKAGKSTKVKATVKTTGKKVNKTLKWTSSNTKYATVNSKGKVKIKKAGRGKTVKITATSTDGSNKKKTVIIKIK